MSMKKQIPTIASFSPSPWERVGEGVRPLPNMAEILET